LKTAKIKSIILIGLITSLIAATLFEISRILFFEKALLGGMEMPGMKWQYDLISFPRIYLSAGIGFILGAFFEGFFEGLFSLKKNKYGNYISIIYFIVFSLISYLILVNSGF
jgi:hypothetical protein